MPYDTATYFDAASGCVDMSNAEYDISLVSIDSAFENADLIGKSNRR